MALSPGNVAKLLDVSTATVRRWSSQFDEFMSPSAKADPEGKKKRTYTSADVDTLRRIRDLSQEGLPLDQIGSQLVHVVTSESPEDAEAARRAAELQDTSTALSTVVSFARELQSHEDRLSTVQRDLDQVKAEGARLEDLATLNKRIEALTSQLEEVRKKQSEWDQLPFWKKLTTPRS